MTDVRYIYRTEARIRDVALPDDIGFLSVTHAPEAIAYFRALSEQFGTMGAIKAVLKVASRRRYFFALVHQGHFASYLWATRRSPRYPIEPDACILGPLMTVPAMRGRGLASDILRIAGSRLSERGFRTLYIDTMPTNTGAQRTFTHADFAPYATLRDGRMQTLGPGETF